MLDVHCSMNDFLIKHIMYADDLVLISPSFAGSYQLMHECEFFLMSHDENTMLGKVLL